MGFRLGVIGLGRIAYTLEEDELRQKPCTHLGGWLLQPGVRLVAACDSDEKKREAFALKYPDVTLYEDYKSMLVNESLDLVSICAYATERAEMVINSSDAGVRGIWCEKTVAASLAECDAMLDAAHRNGTKVLVSHMRRWRPLYVKVKALLDEAVIGEVESVSVQFSSNMLHTGTHAFDILRMWFGDVDKVKARLNTLDDSDQSGYSYQSQQKINTDFGGTAEICFKNGVRAFIHGEPKGYFRFEFEIIGSEGMIRVGNTQHELWRKVKSKRLTGFYELEKEEIDIESDVTPWALAPTDLVAALEGEVGIRCTLTDGAAALAIALAMHYSHKKKGNAIKPKDAPKNLKVMSR